MKQTLIVLIGLVVVPGLALAKVTVEPVTPQRLHKLYTGLLLQGDKLWATTQRSINDNNHRIEVYSQDGKRLLGSAVLPHMADSLAAFGPDVVIAV
ncbi:MAG: hypothetical protein HYR96_06350, partial [Deltaproteobacteria bacterium]|nr:hypothetical protein [Deltaproteobacteria bacterium]